METNPRKRRLIYVYPLIAFLTIVFWACGGGGQDRVQRQQLKETKQETVQNINRYKNDIQERIEYVQAELEEATGETREKLEAAKKDLQTQHDLLAAELAKVEAATLETWNNVIKGTSQVLSDTRKKTNEVSKKVREMLDEE